MMALQKQGGVPVVYQDELLLIVNKPSGWAVVAERWDEHAPSLQDHLGFQPVHRIDKDTSGLVVFAKTPEAMRHLSGQFEEYQVRKVYHAIVVGSPGWTEIECDQPLLPDGDRHHRTVVHPEGKPSRTVFLVKEKFRGYALVEAAPRTGRTHQIRAHLKYLGHPILGDTLYGTQPALFLSRIKKGYKPAARERPLIQRLCLHASRLDLTHPTDATPISVCAPFPEDLELALKHLRKYARVEKTPTLYLDST